MTKGIAFSKIWNNPEFKDWDSARHEQEALKHEDAASHYKKKSDLGNASNLAKNQLDYAEGHRLAARLKKKPGKKSPPMT